MMKSFQIPNAKLQISGGITDELSMRFQNLVRMLLDHAPSDAACQARMTEDQGKYQVQVDIQSSQASFASEKASPNAIGLIESVSTELLDQISNWRLQREVLV